MTAEHEATLVALVEASRGLPGGRREPFAAIRPETDDYLSILHPGLPGRELQVYPADLKELANEGMFVIHSQSDGYWSFDLTQLAFDTYSAIQQRRGEALNRIEQPTRQYLAGKRFSDRHPEADAKWRQAEALLWDSDSENHYSTIGHLCREAMQSFGTSLLAHYPTEGAAENVAATKSRIESVVRTHAQLGERRMQFVTALLALWKAVVDLGQRQEHGAFKESDPLTWEDGRRLVQYTMMAMHEIDTVL